MKIKSQLFHSRNISHFFCFFFNCSPQQQRKKVFKKKKKMLLFFPSPSLDLNFLPCSSTRNKNKNIIYFFFWKLASMRSFGVTGLPLRTRRGNSRWPTFSNSVNSLRRVAISSFLKHLFPETVSTRKFGSFDSKLFIFFWKFFFKKLREEGWAQKKK